MVNIRRVTPNEWDRIKNQIIEIENSCFEESIRSTEEEIIETFKDNSSINLVVEDDNDAITGYLSSTHIKGEYTVTGQDNQIYKGKELYISSIAVSTKSRERGIGKQLIKACVAEARKESYVIVSMHATDDKIFHLGGTLGFKEMEHLNKNIGQRYGRYMELNLK